MTTTVKWYFKTADGMVYGPVDLQVLKTWKDDKVFVPGNQVSSDGENWISADDCDFDAMAATGDAPVAIPDIQFPVKSVETAPALEVVVDPDPVVESVAAVTAPAVEVPVVSVEDDEDVIEVTLEPPPIADPLIRVAESRDESESADEPADEESSEGLEVSELEGEISELVDRLALREDELEEMKAQLSTALSASTASDDSAALVSLREQLAERDARVAVLAKEQDELKARTAAEIASVRAERDSGQGAVSESSDRVAELESEVERLTTELDFATSVAITAAEEPVALRPAVAAPVVNGAADPAFEDLHARLDALRNRCRATLDRYSETTEG